MEKTISAADLILGLQERRCVLDSHRVQAVQHLNAIQGGIAELDLMIEQWQAIQAADPAELLAGPNTESEP